MALSLDTLNLLDDILGQVQLPVAHPEFETQAIKLIAAKRELAEERQLVSPGSGDDNV